MADVLARIVERKRREVAGRLSGPVEAGPTRRSLRAALARPGARFIMEVKRASPSGHRSSVTVDQAAAAYAPVADAISVLTDGDDFGGSLDDLRRVRALYDGPILAKDFIVDAMQVSEARAAGADAVLVMMSVLGDADAAAVMAEARRLAMDAIVEVHDEADLARALALGAAIIGINNRDLKALTTDLAVTQRLAPLVPAGVLIVSESGVKGRSDVLRLAPHVDAFLVGSALMAAPDIADAARELVHGRVKICGLTRARDVALAARAGATHAGFVFVPGSPRAVTEEEAASLANETDRLGLKSVGVFRNHGTEDIARIAGAIRLDAVQLHGNERPSIIATLRSHLSPLVEIWAVRGVGAAVEPARHGSTRFLFDTIKDGATGGTGSAFDWRLVAARPELSEAFIAGGINPANVREASRLGAYGLDLSSGVEASPGVKDGAKLAALFAALRPDARELP